MNIKKGDESIYIPVWAVIAGGIVVESIAKNVCKTVKTCKKKQQFQEEGLSLNILGSLSFIF